MPKKLFYLAWLSAFLVLGSVPLRAYDAELNAMLFESSEMMQQGQIAEALDLLKRSEAKYQNSPEFMNNLAIAYLGNSQPEAALTILRKLVDDDPFFSIIAHNLVEMELQITESRSDKIRPVLFVQTVDSFFDEEIRGAPESKQATPRDDEILPPISGSRQGITVLGNHAQIAQDFVTAWTSHWSAKNYNAYIAMYSKGFLGENGENYEQWAELRQSRLDKEGPILVTANNLQVESLSNIEIRVTFDQKYTSSNYSDLVLKELILATERSDWKIVRESTLATY